MQKFPRRSRRNAENNVSLVAGGFRADIEIQSHPQTFLLERATSSPPEAAKSSDGLRHSS